VDNSGLGTRDSGLAARAAGFTLLELMIVVSIIGILATIAQPMYRNAVVKAREAALQENLFVMRDAIDKYYADNEKYPESLEDLVNKKYIRGVPKDPFTGSNATWQAVQETDDKGAQVGVSDVKSGSDAVGTDGRKYSEW
jgi:general secretion pathway protein G